MNNLAEKMNEIAQRIRAVREDVGLTAAEMAHRVDMSIEDYVALENGKMDISFSFIYKFSHTCGIEITAIIEGQTPKLTNYTVTRKENTMKIVGRKGVIYDHLAPKFKNRFVEPFKVVIPYSETALQNPRQLATHKGQELDIVLKGTLRMQIGDNFEILHEGDAIYYDSSNPHDEVALAGEDVEIYAIVMDPDKTGLAQMETVVVTPSITNVDAAHLQNPVYEKYIETTLDEDGILNGIKYKNIDNFNFAFDVVDEIAKKDPKKTALMYVADDGKDIKFSFADISRYSSQTANYLVSLGIKKGDKVMLVLKRHYQFWFSLLALHKIGAVAIPATNLLVQHDFEYRFNAAGVKAIICTGDGDVTHQVDLAQEKSPTLMTKIVVGSDREGWRSFNKEYSKFSAEYPRPSKEDGAFSYDDLCMFFTSGTTGNPKITTHNHLYPLGHFITAKYWHNVDPNGLHFTMSDTGWAKAMWGKIYGQWLCEAGIFVYDFDKFNAQDVLPLFDKYNITTFCAPPTIYRFFVKEDLSKYNLGSIKYATIAGEALNPEVYLQFLKSTGVVLMEAFGQTETTVIVGNFVGSQSKRGSMGKPSPLYDVDIVDADDKPCKIGEVGEIVIRTDKGCPCGLFKGYYLDPEKTKEAWHDDMYHTGDTAWKDEAGYYWYVGRVDDVIKSSGYRIGPFEIESVIMELPYVLECAVTAASDEIRGQVVKANVVLVQGTPRSDELKKEIQQYVKAHTAPYKYPRIVEFFDELPKTVSGKIKRAELRKM